MIATFSEKEQKGVCMCSYYAGIFSRMDLGKTLKENGGYSEETAITVNARPLSIRPPEKFGCLKFFSENYNFF